MTLEVILAIVQLVAVLAAIAGLWVSLRGIRDQLWIIVFTEYTRRYSEIMDDLPFEARRPNGAFDLDSLDQAERRRVLGAARRYLNLCSEEYYLHGSGKIDHKTWSVWRTGIRDTVRLPWFRAAWTELCCEYDFFEGFQSFMAELVGQ